MTQAQSLTRWYRKCWRWSSAKNHKSTCQVKKGRGQHRGPSQWAMQTTTLLGTTKIRHTPLPIGSPSRRKTTLIKVEPQFRMAVNTASCQIRHPMGAARAMTIAPKDLSWSKSKLISLHLTCRLITTWVTWTTQMVELWPWSLRIRVLHSRPNWIPLSSWVISMLRSYSKWSKMRQLSNSNSSR